MKVEKNKIKKGIMFKCLKCGIEEEIPREMVDYFHEMDGGDKKVPPRFQCEKCDGIMEPIKYYTKDGICYILEE